MEMRSDSMSVLRKQSRFLSARRTRRRVHQCQLPLRNGPEAPHVLSVSLDDTSRIQTFFANDERNSILILGDSKKALTSIPDRIFQTCITSPPYWSLRDYHINGQIGLEESVTDYIDNLVNVFSEVRRTLRDDGTLWINIGDSYTSGGRTWRATDKKNPVRAMEVRPPTPGWLKPKDLIGVPWLLAFALQRQGWYLRADVIWNKPNCQPESVKDRPTRSHEYLFLFSKSEHYSYNSRAKRGPNGRNLRTVWDIKTRAYPGAHFATFPPALVEPCLAVSSAPGNLALDPFIGSGTTGLIALQTRRRFVGIELNPLYLEIAEERLSPYRPAPGAATCPARL
jgi:site-specific DNA-methyltransferase (cytosine-N4-specific)